MVTNDMIRKVWLRLADGFWRQSTEAYERKDYRFSNAWGKAAIRAAEIGRRSKREHRW